MQQYSLFDISYSINLPKFFIQKLLQLCIYFFAISPAASPAAPETLHHDRYPSTTRDLAFFLASWLCSHAKRTYTLYC